MRSSPVVPQDDPTLLFTNAGMNQFKDVFLGTGKRDYLRAVNSQKCIRASGKHNDLEDVGRDHYHHTFFEMLGNWSFGDYFKREAIGWAWELLVKEWKLNGDRLYATVFAGSEQDGLPGDTEAESLWIETTPLPAERVLRFGKHDNFWEMGESGPCGPCSELHYDLGAQVVCDTCRTAGRECQVNAEGCARFIELWNLVFIQFNRSEDGQLSPLPAKHVDTGMGLERVVRVLQGKESNYATELFEPITQELQRITGQDCAAGEAGVAARVIADHVRTICCAIADGALPSNEGRGYVLRRMLRRAVRFGRMLSQHEAFIYQLTPVVSKVLGEAFPEVAQQAPYAAKVIKAEETSFHQTLERGLERFDAVIAQLRSKTIPGEEIFRLYDTYGFPTDLTHLMAREKNLEVDMEGFQQCMQQQQSRARTARSTLRQSGEWQEFSPGEHSNFIGYQNLQAHTTIRRWMPADNQQLLLVLDQTPFYPEGGGQLADQGTLSSDAGNLSVQDVRRDGDYILHLCQSTAASITDPASLLPQDGCLQASVSPTWRHNAQRNHTGTHLLHAALRQTLGEHVHQAGSVVSPEYLRFDYTHFEKPSQKQLEQIEHLANNAIRSNITVHTHLSSYDEAIANGAMALFGEKYGDQVRVVTIGDFSIELCGGCHTPATGNIGFLKLISETAVASGVRRITAFTGESAQNWLQQEMLSLHHCKQLLNTESQLLPQKLQQLLQETKDIKQQLKQLQKNQQSLNAQSMLNNAQTLQNQTKLIVQQVQVSSIDEFRNLADSLRQQLKPGVALLSANINGKSTLLCTVSDDLVKQQVKAGDLVNQIAQIADGKGGGPPHMATASTPNTQKLPSALQQAPQIITQSLP